MSNFILYYDGKYNETKEDIIELKYINQIKHPNEKSIIIKYSSHEEPYFSLNINIYFYDRRIIIALSGKEKSVLTHNNKTECIIPFATMYLIFEPKSMVLVDRFGHHKPTNIRSIQRYTTPLHLVA